MREVIPDWQWGNGISVLTEFLRLLLSIEDRLFEVRVREFLLKPQVGLAYLIMQEQ
jgi:hypothetical protein